MHLRFRIIAFVTFVSIAAFLVVLINLDSTGHTCSGGKNEETQIRLNLVASAVELFRIKSDQTPTMGMLIEEKFLKKAPKNGWGGVIHIDPVSGTVWTRTPHGGILSSGW